MASWVVCALCALVIIKPQEFVPELAGLPLVYVAFAAALVAIVLDIIRRRLRPALGPAIPMVGIFFAWALATTALKVPLELGADALSFAILEGVFLACAMGLASRAGLMAFAWTFAACAVLVTAVAIVQSERPFGCFLGAAEDWEGRGELAFDGRPCTSILDCRKDAPNPDGNYRCERVGPLATSTIGGRVRYRGSLADPNELSLMIAAAVPFVFALAERPRRQEPLPALARPSLLPPLLSDRFLRRIAATLRAIPALVAVGAMGFAVVLARSRTGLLVFLFVVGASLIRKVGAWGLVADCIVAPPMILFGGRSGTEADESTDERAELLREGFELLRETRGIGIGAHQFADASSIGLTAHNAYLLAAVESGVVGLMLFGFVVYLALKVPYAIWIGRCRVDPTTARFAPALAISLTGTALGIAFLSWTYKDVLYMLIGASAALYAVAKSEDPRVRVGISVLEALAIVGAMIVLMAALYLGARLHQ